MNISYLTIVNFYALLFLTKYLFISMAYERVSVSANYLMERTQRRPKIAIICGSGLGKSKLNAGIHLDGVPRRHLNWLFIRV